MRPFVRNGIDTATLSPVSSCGKLRKGMLLLFRYEGHYCLHRLRGIENGMLVMKGDGNYRLCELIRTSDIAACVSSVERDGHKISYGSLHWHLLTLYSLAVKVLRTACRDLRPKK